MYVLHGSWLGSNSTGASKGGSRRQGDPNPGDQFVLWAEASNPRSERTSRPALIRPKEEAPAAGRTKHGHRGAKRPPAHPFAASKHELLQAWQELDLSFENYSGESKGKRSDSNAVILSLPSTRRGPEPSHPLLDQAEAIKEKRVLAKWQAESLVLPSAHILDLLAGLPPDQDAPPGIRIGADLRFWQTVSKLALELLARQRLAPLMVSRDGRYLAIWQPLVDEPDVQERLARLARVLPPVCRAVSREEKEAKRELASPRALIGDFLSSTIDAFARQHADFERRGEARTIAEAWLDSLSSRSPIIAGSDASLAAFYEQYRAWAEPVPGATGDTFRICFRLEPPVPGDGPAARGRSRQLAAGPWTLHYLLQATDDPSLLIPADAVWQGRGSALKFLNRKFDAPQEHMLAGLGLASKLFPPIETSLRHARPEECSLTVEQAYTFMRETALLLQSSGFGVQVPNIGGRFGVRLRLKPAVPRPAPARATGVAGFTFENIVEYDWQLALGDQTLTREEFEHLANLKVPLVEIRGQWVELRPDQIQQAIKFWESRRESGGLTLQEALRVALSLEPADGAAALPVMQVDAEGWIGDLMQRLTSGSRASSGPVDTAADGAGASRELQALPTPQGFHGTLRPYQSTGLSWLAFLRQWGLGACLADDMGLGKTPQMIALLLHEQMQPSQPRPALVICPTSVVSNWQHELARFAPDLRVLVYHGAARKKQSLADRVPQCDVVISSYALLQRDEKDLAPIDWGDIILDEAQNIKNPSTKQAQAARKLAERAEWRAALTGTPVENRLSELWSIFQFLNPGFLGSQRDFGIRFAKPIERVSDAEATRKLKSLVDPFILRRVKTDPSVISDLPEKNEMKVYCTLTREQATLYEAVVRDSIKRIETSEGIERRGIVLATLMKLKQVCNHPAQFLNDGSPLPDRSGKLARLAEMLDEVKAVHDRALIFTQFAEMGKLLQVYLQEYLGEPVLFLHGGTPAKVRTRMIDQFQTDPQGPRVFILSIKAGGTGLNLTRANHVFHFDRWWNPAVENQATDRAFRIGQTRNVQVWKYLCAGTFEEKIDEMIERKKALAETIVGTSEAWITDLSTDQLKDLFALRRQAVSEA